MQNNQQSAEIFYNTVLPLVLVEPDPENPRKLAIRLQDIRDGFSRNDPLFTQKEAELQKLREVAGTITRSGILNPIIVYKHADKYRIVAGERRFLATFISGAKEIEVRVYQQKPNGFDLKLAQWVENTAREDLSLMERLDNVRDMITEYAKQYPETKVTATWLKDKTSLSLPQATYYINVLRAPDNVIAAIKRGDINSLDKAAIITSSPDAELRAKAISACKAGMSLKNLREMLNSFKQQPDKANAGSSNAISLGSTLNCKVIETIVRVITNQPEFQDFAHDFTDCNWSSSKEASKAFKKLIALLEKHADLK
jgi:ParB family chromosome partitioning protein